MRPATTFIIFRMKPKTVAIGVKNFLNRTLKTKSFRKTARLSQSRVDGLLVEFELTCLI
jgi:hypothetical protein